jgi:hypothetical protein
MVVRCRVLACEPQRLPARGRLAHRVARGHVVDEGDVELELVTESDVRRTLSPAGGTEDHQRPTHRQIVPRRVADPAARERGEPFVAIRDLE